MAIDDGKEADSAAGPETAAPWPVKVARPGIQRPVPERLHHLIQALGHL